MACLLLKFPFHRAFIEMKCARRHEHPTCPWGGDSQLSQPRGLGRLAVPGQGEQPLSQGASCSLQSLVFAVLGKMRASERRAYVLPRCLWYVQRDLLLRGSCPFSMVTVTSLSAPHSAATPKEAQFLMLGYSTLCSEGEQTLLAPLWFHIPTPTSYTAVSLIQSSLHLFCCAFQFSTTAAHMIHKISLFAQVIYLHLLLPGILMKQLPPPYQFFRMTQILALVSSPCSSTHSVVSAGSSYSSI